MNTTLLTVAGYERETFEEDWEDVGGPESGPRLVGHPAGEVFTLADHEIVVIDNAVIHHGAVPALPEGWNP